MPSETTTVEVTHEIWAALDRRKNAGESFDDVIRKLINASPVGVGQLKTTEQAVHRVGVAELPLDTEKECSHYDIITGDLCGASADYEETVKYGEDGDEQTIAFCEDHFTSE